MVFAHDMIVYVKILKHKKLLDLISHHSEAAGYKVNIQKSLLFLCTRSEPLEFDIKT